MAGIPGRSASFCLVGLALLSGCVRPQKIHVSVSALAAPESDSARLYVLLPVAEGVKPSDLQFQEYATYLRRALQFAGFEEAGKSEDADLLIGMSYSVSEPKEHTYTYSIPHWGQTGISSSTTYGTANTLGTLNRGRYSGTTSYQGTTYYQPRYGVTGYSTGVGTFVTYTRALALVGFDAKVAREGGEPKEYWRLTAISVGNSGDLRAIFPFLAAAARPYLGKATDAAVETQFAMDDERVAEIRGIPRKEN